MGRVDLARMKLTAGSMLNVIPRVIGPFQARPGLAYLGTTDGNGVARNIPFVFSATDTALVELSDVKLRVRVDGTLISRASVSTAVTNGDFSSGTGWTLTTTGTGVADINSTHSGKLTLQTPGRGDTTLAKRSVSVAGGDQNVVHALNITVDTGPVKFRCGSSSGGEEYIGETELNTGFHSLAFTPTGGTFYVQFSVESEAERIVDSIVVASAGTMEIVAPWAEDDLFTLRYAQSGDVMYLVSSLGTYHPKRIERRAAESWSLTTYEFKDGPFRGKSADVTLTPNARTGNGTLTASAPFFDAGHVGAVFRLTHRRTSVSSVLTDGDRYTDSMRVSGNAKYDNDSDGTDEKTDERDVTFTISGTWVGTISLQVSYDDGDTYQETEQWTANVGPITRTPGYANSVAFSRLGFQAGDYTSGSATITATYTGGGGDGYLRITGVTNSTTATYEVISRLHDAAATQRLGRRDILDLSWVSNRHRPVRGAAVVWQFRQDIRFGFR